MQRVILAIAALVPLLSGCGILWSTKSDDVPEPPPRIVQAIAKPKSEVREPGSLWSPDSTWNTVYSSVPGHSAGDVVTIKIDKDMKNKLIAMTNAQLPPPPEDKAKGKKKRKKKKVASANGASTSAGGLNPPPKPAEAMAVSATIIEVKARGVYRIASDAALKLAPTEPYITIEGEVRERDLDANDTVDAEKVLDLRANPTSLLPKAPRGLAEAKEE